MVPDLNGPSVMVCKDTNYYLIYNKIFYGAAGSRFMGACLALVITEMNRNDRSITEIFFLLGGLAGAFGGRLFGLEEHYRNYSLSLIFCYGKKKKTSFLFTCS